MSAIYRMDVAVVLSWLLIESDSHSAVYVGMVCT